MNHNKNSQPKRYWLDALITIIWTHAQNRWKYRNQKAHPKGINDNKNTREILMEQITNMYNKQHEMLQQDRFIFNRSLEGWKASTTTSMKQWIKSNRPFIKYCLSEALKQNKLHSSDIHTYMQNSNETVNQQQKHKGSQKRQQQYSRQTNPPVATKQMDIRTINGWANAPYQKTHGEQQKQERQQTAKLSATMLEEKVTDNTNNQQTQNKLTDHFIQITTLGRESNNGEPGSKTKQNIHSN